MSESNPDRLPERLLEVAEKLREGRVSATPLELDELKLRAKAQAARGRSYRSRGAPLRSRVVTLALTVLIVGGTTAGGIAASGGNSGGGRGPPGEDKTGEGCGGKKHLHTPPPGGPNKKTPADSPPRSAPKTP